MNTSQFIFKMTDIFMKEPQNAIEYDGVYHEVNIPYADYGGENTMGDIYYKPELLRNGKKYPVVLYIHGGGFIMGDKKYRVGASEQFADHEYFVYSINYRLPPEVDLHSQLEDVVNAFNFLGELAERYNIDLDRIIVSGDSSGGFCASFLQGLATNEGLAEKLELPELKYKPATAVLGCGMYNVETEMKELSKISNDIVVEMANMILQFDVDKDLSNIHDYPNFDLYQPYSLVNNKWCPTFICWARKDIFCPEQGQPMTVKLLMNNVKLDSYVANSVTNMHCFHLLQRTSASQKCMAKCFNFLDGVLLN